MNIDANFEEAANEHTAMAARIDDIVDNGMQSALEELRDDVTNRIESRGLVGSRTGNRGQIPPLRSDKAWPIREVGDSKVLVPLHERAVHLELDNQPAGNDKWYAFEDTDGSEVIIHGTNMSPRKEEASGWFRQSVAWFNAESIASNEVAQQIAEARRAIYGR